MVCDVSTFGGTLVVTAAGIRAMSTRLGNRMGQGCGGAFVLFVLVVVLAADLVFTHFGDAYPAYRPVVLVPFGGFLTVWCLNKLLWHWKELEGRERLARLLGGLLGFLILAVVLNDWLSESH
jgi:hypothetical protein